MSRRVLVTGAASGLGAALVAEFVARGDRVLVTDLAPAAASSVVEPDERSEDVSRPGGASSVVEPDERSEDVSRPGEMTTYRRLDVTSEDDWTAARTWIEQEWGGLDLLVNNAGVAAGGRIDVLDLDHWRWITEINLFGVVRGCRTFAPLLKAQGSGHVVNVASAAGLVHPPGMSSYNAVKAGVVALSETLQYELAPYGITTSVVCPTFFRTNLAASLPGADPLMEKVATRLIERSRLSAADIATRVMRGIDRRQPIIIPDRNGRTAYRSKRFARALYDREQRAFGRRIRDLDDTTTTPPDQENP